MNGLEYLDQVAAALAKLPGIGRRSAERMAYSLAWNSEETLRQLLEALKGAAEHVRLCERCGGITAAEEMPCRLCTASNRDGSMVCVVQDPADIVAIERTGSYKGRYHALMGVVSPLHGESPRDLRLAGLLRRVEEERFTEVILALGMDVESEATAGYVAELLKGRPVKVTKPASGIPVGSGIRYSDSQTLARALKGRQAL